MYIDAQNTKMRYFDKKYNTYDHIALLFVYDEC